MSSLKQSSPLIKSKKTIEQHGSLMKSVSPNKDLSNLNIDSEQKYFERMIKTHKRRLMSQEGEESKNEFSTIVSPMKEFQ